MWPNEIKGIERMMRMIVIAILCVFMSVCGLGSGVQSEKEGRKVEGAGN